MEEMRPKGDAQVIGELVERLLSPPVHPPGSLAGGSAAEHDAVVKWKRELRDDANEARNRVLTHSSEAVRILDAVLKELR